MSSLLIYNVENTKNEEKPLYEKVSKLLTGTVYIILLEFVELLYYTFCFDDGYRYLK